MAGNVVNFKVLIPLKLCVGLTGNYHSPAVPIMQSGTNSFGICNPVSSTYKNTYPGRS